MKPVKAIEEAITKKVKRRFWALGILLFFEIRRIVIQIITQINMEKGAYLVLNFKFCEIKDKIGATRVIVVKIRAEIVMILLARSLLSMI